MEVALTPTMLLLYSRGLSPLALQLIVNLTGLKKPAKFFLSLIEMRQQLVIGIILVIITMRSTLAGSCMIDASGTHVGFTMAVAGVGQTLIKTSSIAVTCDTATAFKLGVTAGNYYLGSTHYLSDGIHPNIPYTIQQAGVAFGDFDINSYDPSYAPSTTQNAANLVNSGTMQIVNIDFVAVIPNGQSSGTYNDSVSFVLAWP